MNHLVESGPEKQEAAVLTRGLGKTYSDETAVENLNIHVPEGEVYVLVGANGAGKTTVLKALMNLVPPDAGTASVFGLDTVEHGAQVRAQVGYVPEHYHVGYPWMRCDSLLEHASTYYERWDSSYAAHLGSAFDLRLTRRIGTLSKGESRRLQLVVALSHRPPLLLLDEATEALDPIMRKRLLTLLTEHLNDTPATVIISTHHVGEVESLIDRVGVLREGRLVAQMSRDQLLRTVHRYRLRVPVGWQPPSDLQVAGSKRSSTGREINCILAGEEHEIGERLSRTGAHVQEVTSLSLEEAALALLSEEVAR